MSNPKLQAKKSLGQHFLNSPVVPSWMCDAAQIMPGDFVVEIGPGTGVLTKELLQRGAIVYALEADARAITILEDVFANEIAAEKLYVVHCDVRTFTPLQLPSTRTSYKVVANIPYYLSGMLFRTFLESERQPATLVYLVQKEVAKRATSELSRDEKESLLSLSVKAFGTPKYIKTVTRGHFSPPPKVDSAIIAIYQISNKHFTHSSAADFFKLLHLGLGAKRKQLFGSLRAQYTSERLEHAFSTLNLSKTVRGEDLPIETWLSLRDLLLQ